MSTIVLAKKQSTAATVFHVTGSLIVVMGILLLVPLIPLLIFREFLLLKAFLLPAAVSFMFGFGLRLVFPSGRLYFKQGLLVCGVAWFVLCIFAAMPFVLGAGLSPVNAYFETVSGITTTGITVITAIEVLPRSILFWRSLIQWIGGLGILTLFLMITFKSNNAYFQLFSAEAHKIESTRPTPNVSKTAVILWSIYGGFTALEMIILKILGLSLFDAVCHSLTTLSTGGFSTYDASIDYFRQAGYTHYKAIEYVIAFFMMLGGINFLIHFKVITGRFKEVLRDTEFRAYLTIIGTVTALILVNRVVTLSQSLLGRFEPDFRTALFTVISIVTTTGYGTTDINMPFFPAMSQQLILVLMLVGGSVGSTAGGLKVLRMVVTFKLFRGQIKRLRLPRQALSDVLLDRSIFPQAEIKRISGLFFGWLLLILVGGMITALFTELDGWQAFSGMFSAVGNIGPCYFSVAEMSQLPIVVKLTYIFGMLAGRLEILPVLLVFSPKAWIR